MKSMRRMIFVVLVSMFSAVTLHAQDYNLMPNSQSMPTSSSEGDEAAVSERKAPKTSYFVDETYPNGDRYVGYMRNGMCHGHGTYYWADGSRCEGNFKKSVLDGYGVLYNPDGTKAYEGEFKNDAPHGEGTLYFSNGRKYAGEWKDDKPAE